MKRYNFTITELLTVIAIIAILAGIAIPTINSARRRSRTTSCISNQGQTMKTLISVMNDNRNMLHSGRVFSTGISSNGLSNDDVVWTQYLADKRYIRSMEALRCPEIHTYTTSEKELSSTSITEAYGLTTTENNRGRFDFRGSRLFMFGGASGTQIAPSMLILGGCSTSDGRTVAARTNFAENDIVSVGRPTLLHHNNTINLFAFDGHAETLDAETYSQNKYYPNQTGNTTGEAVNISSESKRNAI